MNNAPIKPLSDYTKTLKPKTQELFRSLTSNSINTDDLIQANYPDTLYHYTSINSLVEISKNNRLFFSKYDYLNDVSEIDYGINLFMRQLETGKYEKKTCDIVFNLLKRVQLNNDNSYILCFTEEKDSLQMWKYYGTNDGYNIGINTSDFIKVLHDVKFSLIPGEDNKSAPYMYSILTYKVIYDKSLQESIIEDALNIMNQIVIDGKDSTLGIFSRFISNCLLFFKSTEFENEKEIRFVFNLRNDEINRSFRQTYLHHRVKCGSLIPYVIFEFKELPIDSITIGPYCTNDMSEKGLKSYLHSIGWGDITVKNTVRTSQIKLRY